jgi:hypothetical protein
MKGRIIHIGPLWQWRMDEFLPGQEPLGTPLGCGGGCYRPEDPVCAGERRRSRGAEKVIPSRNIVKALVQRVGGHHLDQRDKGKCEQGKDQEQFILHHIIT